MRIHAFAVAISCRRAPLARRLAGTQEDARQLVLASPLHVKSHPPGGHAVSGCSIPQLARLIIRA